MASPFVEGLSVILPRVVYTPQLQVPCCWQQNMLLPPDQPSCALDRLVRCLPLCLQLTGSGWSLLPVKLQV